LLAAAFFTAEVERSFIFFCNCLLAAALPLYLPSLTNLLTSLLQRLKGQKRAAETCFSLLRAAALLFFNFFLFFDTELERTIESCREVLLSAARGGFTAAELESYLRQVFVDEARGM
jgi:hypothetical protein